MPNESLEVIRIVVVHAQTLLREALGCLIDANPDLRVVAAAASCNDVAQQIDVTNPDVIVLDLPRDDEKELVAVAALCSSLSAKVLLLCGQPNSDVIGAAMGMGVAGVVSKNQAGSVLCKAIRRVHGGELWLDRSVTASVFQKMRQPRVTPAASANDRVIKSLSGREREIVMLVANGLNTHDLAERLHISEKTARNHLASIYEKLGVSSRVELALYALRNGLAGDKTKAVS